MCFPPTIIPGLLSRSWKSVSLARHNHYAGLYAFAVIMEPPTWILLNTFHLAEYNHFGKIRSTYIKMDFKPYIIYLNFLPCCIITLALFNFRLEFNTWSRFRFISWNKKYLVTFKTTWEAVVWGSAQARLLQRTFGKAYVQK